MLGPSEAVVSVDLVQRRSCIWKKSG